MNIAILETGAPPEALQARHGCYPEMFQRLLGPSFDYSVFSARRGELPNKDHACDAYLITGSASGVYDPESWIDELRRFVRAHRGRAPMIGVCFGHQLMAEAFGGKVLRSSRGWGIGLHTYRIWKRAAWMGEASSISVPVSHQDQVVEPPPNAQVLGGSDFARYALLAYPQHRAISLQCHPEFTPEYAAELIALRRNVLFSDELADAAHASLQRPNDRDEVAAWLRRFLAAA